MGTSVKLLAGWRDVLTLCKVEGGETVLLLVTEAAHPDHVAAARATATTLGARVLSLELGEPPVARMAGDSTAYVGPTALTGNRAAVEAMKHADMVIDFMGIDRGSEQQEILDTGTRILLIKEPPEVFLRLLPTADDKRRALAASDRLGRARTMRVTSEAGTDLSADLGEYRTLVQYGFADEPGRWDHCPSTFVATWPNERSTNGTVVLDAGDTILPFKDYVRTPITLRIESGYIRSIEGGFDARYLRDYMDKFRDPEGFAVSHLGWGLQPKAHWTTLGMYDKRQSHAMEARSFYGNFQFSTGPNTEAGGTRNTPCHLDMPMRACSVWLDNDPIVANQDIVPADQRA